jgi:hypothetical protein
MRFISSCCPRLVALLALTLPVAWLTPAPCLAQAPPAAEQPKPYVGRPDESDSFDLVLGIDGGGGFDSSSPRRPAQYVGAKLGLGCCVRGKHPFEHALTVTADLGYDRLRSRNGASAELSVMVPVVRFPNPGSDEARKFVRIYAEPGGGFHVGGGAFGYFSIKGMIALMSQKQILSFRVQHRFPFPPPAHGDTRVMFGLMYPLCKQCGLD